MKINTVQAKSQKAQKGRRHTQYKYQIQVKKVRTEQKKSQTQAPIFPLAPSTNNNPNKQPNCARKPRAPERKKKRKTTISILMRTHKNRDPEKTNYQYSALTTR